MVIPERENIFFQGKGKPPTHRTVTLGIGAALPTIQLPPTAKAENEFNSEEFKHCFQQAGRQVQSGVPALVLVIRFHPEINFDVNRHKTGWHYLDGELQGYIFERVDLQMIPDAEMRFKKGGVIVSEMRLDALGTDNQLLTSRGLNDVAITTTGLVYPKPE